MAVIARNETIPSLVVVSGKPIPRVIPEDIVGNYRRLSVPWIVNGNPEEIDGYPITTLGYDVRVLALQIYEKFFI